MGAATYIGRVGGLAVALGVGTAIATGQGVATADDTNNSTAPNTSTDGSTSTNSTSTNPTTGPTTGASTIQSTEPSNTTQTPQLQTTSTQTTTSSTTSTTVAEGVVVSAQTNTGTSGTTGTTEPTHEAEPTAKSSQTPTPAKTAAPQPTQTTEPEESTKSPDAQEVSTPPSASKSSNESGASLSVAKPSAKASAPTVEPFADPATNIQQPDKVAVFADARALAAAGTTNVSPMMAAQVTPSAVTEPATPASPPDPLTAVANVVSSVINWVLNPLAGTSPTTPAQPPLMWGLLAFARREFENFFNALGGRSQDDATLAAAQTTSLALADTQMTRLALAAPAVTANPPYLPFPSAQVSPSTQFVGWVTGDYIYDGNPTLANTSTRYSVWGTDVGTMWDNGIPDDLSTTNIDEHQVLIAVGDTFSGPNSAGWRPNTIFRSSDTNLTDGMTIADGQWFNGNMFGGAPLGPNSTTARQIIFPDGLPAGVTLIPTAGISVPTPGTQFGATQYLSFMSVKQWGSPGQWTTNYSAIAYSVDNGENWQVAPSSVRLNSPYGGNTNFQQSAFVMGNDGYVYSYGTPNGRQGAAYVSRVLPQDILDVTKYDYYSAGSPGGWFGLGATPAGWYKNDPGKATAVFGQDTGACGVANPGNQVSEMSVQYNKSLNKYVVLYCDQFNNVVMRTSDTPQGTWSSAKVLMGQQNGGIYAPMMNPWSPSTQGTGTDLYWNLSLSSDYNVMLMRTDLTKV